MRGSVITKYRGNKPLEVYFVPGRVDLLPVANKGREYPVPTTHLGRQISHISAIEFGGLGIRYCIGMVKEAAAYLPGEGT